VPPVELIPIAERSDLILALGEWVLRTACAQNHTWPEAGLPPITVGVNLSARRLTSQDIAEGVETREQLALLYAHDCDEIQGYLFSRLIPADALAALLREDHALALPRPEGTEPFRDEATLASLDPAGHRD
jgi:EAL domain-containing protein (putative c-di-GMP-specific phosphodiesterase class I)